MKALIGYRVCKVEVSRGEMYLVFTLNTPDKRRLIYCAAGECCSESWFADIIGARYLSRSPIVSVEEILMDDIPRAILDPYLDDGRGRQGSDVVYGYRLGLTSCYVEIVFRNSSNGYYGGKLCLVESLEDDENGPIELVDITGSDQWSSDKGVYE